MPLIVVLAVWMLLLALATPVLLVYHGRWSPRARLRRRALAIVGEARNRGKPTGDDAATRRKLIQGKLKELEGQRQRNRRDTLRQLLLQSGLPLTLRAYALASLGVGVVTGLALLALGMSGAVGAVGALGAGLGLPRLILRLVIRKRQAAFTSLFADALDILVRGTRSGLPVGECLRVIGREMPDPVGYEFRMLVEGMRIGMTLDQALERSLERIPTTDLKFFAIVLVIQQQTGGNLAATLENLANVLRARKRLDDKIQALSSEAKASAMIIGSLPFLVGAALWLVSPDYIDLLFTTNLGTTMLAGGALWMVIGVAVMRQMIHFRF